MYEQLREEGKIFEIKEEKLIKKTSRENININSLNVNVNSNVNSNNSPDSRMKRKSSTVNNNMNSNSSQNTNIPVNSSNYANPVVVFSVKTDKKDEKFLIAKNYIKALKQSEFYMI
jgi:hypothetical protein